MHVKRSISLTYNSNNDTNGRITFAIQSHPLIAFFLNGFSMLGKMSLQTCLLSMRWQIQLYSLICNLLICNCQLPDQRISLLHLSNLCKPLCIICIRFDTRYSIKSDINVMHTDGYAQNILYFVYYFTYFICAMCSNTVYVSGTFK